MGARFSARRYSLRTLPVRRSHGAATRGLVTRPLPGVPRDYMTASGWTGPERRRVQGCPKVSVLVPARNESLNLPYVLRELPDGVLEVVLVDGASTDSTVAIARAARPDIRIVTQTGRGKGDALRCGLLECRGDIIVILDADGSMDPAEISLFVGALLAGAEFVTGSRYIVGGGSVDLTRLRSVGNRGLGGLANLLFGTRCTDINYGYHAFWRRCLPQLDLDCDGFEIEALMHVRAAKVGLRVSEVPSFEHRRLHGASNLHVVRDGMRILRMIVRERLRGSARAPAGAPVGTADTAVDFTTAPPAGEP
jgi:glycosyltransferase involved in cell wall biosynthesis